MTIICVFENYHHLSGKRAFMYTYKNVWQLILCKLSCHRFGETLTANCSGQGMDYSGLGWEVSPVRGICVLLQTNNTTPIPKKKVGTLCKT